MHQMINAILYLSDKYVCTQPYVVSGRVYTPLIRQGGTK